MILADYRMQKPASFDLRHFVELNFTLPKENDMCRPKGKLCVNISMACGRS